jgi:hypothetical protein
MRYVCLGYREPGRFETLSESERDTVLDECLEYDDYLRAHGHLVAEMPLQPPETAVTLSWRNGEVATTGGPFSETGEELAGIQVLEARDLNHAIQLISQHPGVKIGTAEIRPVADLGEVREESGRRRREPTSRGGRPRGRA